MEQAHLLETHSAPQQSNDVEHSAPLMHVDDASVLRLEMPNRADMNEEVVFISTSRTNMTGAVDCLPAVPVACSTELHVSLTVRTHLF
jgi:hypothetical protein